MLLQRHGSRFAGFEGGIALLLSLALSGAALAAEMPQLCYMTRFSDPVPETGASFGAGVAAAGNTLVITAPSQGGNGTPGRAYVYEREGPEAPWELKATLVASDGYDTDHFGWDAFVSADERLVFIGAPEARAETGTPGAVYVFRRPEEGWRDMTESEKITTPDVPSGAYFGIGISFHEGTLVCGSLRGAFVFRYDGADWIQIARLVPKSGLSGLDFGCGVDIWGSTIVVGARTEDSNRGAAYIFVEPEGGWEPGSTVNETAKLTASDGVPGDWFGYQVAVRKDTIVVSARYGDGGVADSGALYIFRRPQEGWRIPTTESAKLTSSEGTAGQEFEAIMLLDHLVGVAVQHYRFDGTPVGAVLLYAEPPEGWHDMTESLRVDPPERQGGQGWTNLTSSGDDLIVGANAYDLPGYNRAGAAFVFRGLLGEDCNANGFADSCDILSGTSMDEDGDGVPDECKVNVELIARGPFQCLVEIVVALSSPWEVTGFVLPVAHDPAVLSPLSVDKGSSWTDLGIDPDFWFQDLSPETCSDAQAGAVIAAIVSLQPPMETLPRNSALELVRLTYQALDIGTTSIGLIDRCLGDPPASLEVDVLRRGATVAMQPDTSPISVQIAGSCFVRGDADEDCLLRLNDVITIAYYLYKGRKVGCLKALDVNDDGYVELTDAVILIDYLFRGGPPPLSPFPDCGPDPTADMLSCNYHACCCNQRNAEP